MTTNTPWPPPPPPRRSQKATRSIVVVLLIAAFALVVGGLVVKISPSTTASVTAPTVVTIASTSVQPVKPATTLTWLISHVDAISGFVTSVSATVKGLGVNVTPTEMIGSCLAVKNLVDPMYDASWKNDSGAPESWRAMLSAFRTGFTECSTGAFDTALPYIQEGAKQLAAFNDDMTANMP